MQVYILNYVNLSQKKKKRFRYSADGPVKWSFPVAQIVEHGTSNAKIMDSIPRESKS